MSNEEQQQEQEPAVFFTKRRNAAGKEYYFTRAEGAVFDTFSKLKPNDFVFINLYAGKDGKSDGAVLKFVLPKAKGDTL